MMKVGLASPELQCRHTDHPKVIGRKAPAPANPGVADRIFPKPASSQ
jgi:hypothetical protein